MFVELLVEPGAHEADARREGLAFVQRGLQHRRALFGEVLQARLARVLGHEPRSELERSERLLVCPLDLLELRFGLFLEVARDLLGGRERRLAIGTRRGRFFGGLAGVREERVLEPDSSHHRTDQRGDTHRLEESLVGVLGARSKDLELLLIAGHGASSYRQRVSQGTMCSRDLPHP